MEPDNYCVATCPSGITVLQGKRCERILGHEGKHIRHHKENEGKPDELELTTWWD